MQVPRVGHKHIKQWFKSEYGIELPFSTISNILSSKFDHLDQLGSNHDDAKRCRPPKYPDLEIALAECIGRMKTAGIDLTGVVLLNTAHELWPNIPAYRTLPIPALSGGWVEKFKTRHRIKLRSLQVEAASTRASKTVGSLGALELSPTGDVKLGAPAVPTPIADSMSQRTLESIRLRTMNYSQNDIFTMSETELYWRLVPNANSLREIASQSRRDSKERVSVALSCNASGTQRLPPYVVGHYGTPRSFQAPGNDMKSINCYYSSNRIAWMTVSEWRTWIKWFDGMMDRPVLLILDPHKAHEVAYHNLSDSYTLRNTEVLFLPPNVSSLHSPLELGIMQNFKALYRKTLLTFISEFYLQGDLESLLPSPVSLEQEFMDYGTRGGIPQGVQYIDQIEDPHIAINLYIALYWIQKSWLMDVSSATINQAWVCSTLVDESKLNEAAESVSPTFTTISMLSHEPQVPASTILSRPTAVVSRDVLQEISRLSQLIRAQAGSASFMGSASAVLQPEYYVYPMEEAVMESEGDFIELSTAQFYDSEVDPGDEPIYVIAPVSPRDADRAVKLLLNFEEQHPSSSVRYMQLLSEYKDMISQRSSNAGSRQASIASIVEPIPISMPGTIQPALGAISPNNSVAQHSMLMTSPMAQTSQYLPKYTTGSYKRRQDSQGSRAGTSISTSISRKNSSSSTTSIGGAPDTIDSRLPTAGNAQRNSFTFGSSNYSFPPTSNIFSGGPGGGTGSAAHQQTYNPTGFYGSLGAATGQYGMSSTPQTYSSNVRSMGAPGTLPNNSLFSFSSPYSTGANTGDVLNQPPPPGGSSLAHHSYGSAGAGAGNNSSSSNFASLLSSNPIPGGPAAGSSSSATANPATNLPLPPSGAALNAFSTGSYGGYSTGSSSVLPRNSSSLLESTGQAGGDQSQASSQQQGQPGSQQPGQQGQPSSTQPPGGAGGSYSPNSPYTFFNANTAPVYYPAHAS